MLNSCLTFQFIIFKLPSRNLSRKMAIDNEHAGAVLSQIFENGVSPENITLIAGIGGQRISIHRVVLMANSKYFTTLLGPNFNEAGENEFILDETDGPTLKAIVDFCYTGRIDLIEENVSKYLTIASSVELRFLERKCSRFFTDKLDMNNAVETFRIADKYSKQKLRQKSINLICGLFDKFPPSHIEEIDYQLLKEIMKSDRINAEEQFVLERLMHWFQEDEGKRGQHMSELLELIRLPLIPTQYLNGNAIQMIYKKFDCLEHLLAEYKRRTANPTPNAGIRRHVLICSLFKQFKGEVGFEQSAVKVERYNSTLNELDAAGDIALGDRIYFDEMLHGNNVYILGGEINGVHQKSASVFDLKSGEEKVLPEMRCARAFSASVLIGKFIYVFGGRNDTNERLRSCERFDLETETWKTLQPMNVARSSAAATVMNGYIYIAGGFNTQSNTLKDVELFDPQNNEWITLSPMNDARQCFALFTAKNYLYAMGFSSSIERYDPWRTRWTKIDPPEVGVDVTSSVVVNDTIYVIGKNGDFGEIKFDEKGGCSFISSGESKFKTGLPWRHRLFWN